MEEAIGISQLSSPSHSCLSRRLARELGKNGWFLLVLEVLVGDPAVHLTMGLISHT
jgi:hypothetical protein